MSNTKETKVEDHDYSLQPVPQFARRRLLTMFMIMLGFTFFSASMWTGQTLGDSLDLSGFIGSLILGGIILAIYTGSLAYVGAKTGLSLDLLARLLSTQLTTSGEKHLLDHNRIYYKLLRRIIARGQEKGELDSKSSVSEMVKLYALAERALMYDWCLCGGEYSLRKYSADIMSGFLSSFLPK